MSVVYKNPPTVVVVLVPVAGRGLLMIRRGKAGDDGYGKIAIPGGYQIEGETWQEAGARELLEETGVVVDTDELLVREVVTTPDRKTNLLFCEAREIQEFRPIDDRIGDWHDGAGGDTPLHEYLGMTEEQYATWLKADAEVSEAFVIREPVETAFPIHTEQVADFFKVGPM